MAARRKSGFTLIELLVVIAIIAILAAILFPVFAKARESGRKSTCLNNIKECSLAVIVYMESADSTLPSSAINGGNQANFCTGSGGGTTFPPGATRVSWAQCIYDQMKTKDIMFCVSDSNKDLGNGAPYLSYWWKTAIDAAWNPSNAAGINSARKESDFSYGSSQIVLYERYAFHSGETTLANGVMINVAYLDNHAKSVALADANGSTGIAPTTDITKAGEPAYFNYQEQTANGKNAGPLGAGQNFDPRNQSDHL